MKPKHLILAIAVILAAGGLWFAGSAWRTRALHKSSMGADSKTPHGPLNPGVVADGRANREHRNPGTGAVDAQGRPRSGHVLRAPVPNRRFAEFTPEQRVQFARQGHGPGG
ncbi:MAG TPA: hypothetical protein VMZ27_00825 [Candidatus Saccharimonadales bacterium]|nr:hypothetical protein [Candidatus Saccharimonadales bacterium]